jgi:hypothetical protein
MSPASHSSIALVSAERSSSKRPGQGWVVGDDPHRLVRPGAAGVLPGRGGRLISSHRQKVRERAIAAEQLRDAIVSVACSFCVDRDAGAVTSAAPEPMLPRSLPLHACCHRGDLLWLERPRQLLEPGGEALSRDEHEAFTLDTRMLRRAPRLLTEKISCVCAHAVAAQFRIDLVRQAR